MTTFTGQIQKVCVIGSGNMGAGIAGQIANSGIPVFLLDIVPDGATDRDAVARSAVERMSKMQPAPLMSAAAAELIEIGNIEDDLGRAAECDWIIEAIIERLDLKHDLYGRIEKVKRPGTAVSSNTSTIPLKDLVQGRSEQFQRDFLITHFFNPPRYMKLLELVLGPVTDRGVAEAIEAFCSRRLGKSVVHARDTPGFIANRIGNYWAAIALAAAIEQNVSVEEADQIASHPFGFPKTGVFGLLDLVGIDLAPLVFKSLLATLPVNDAFHKAVRPWPIVDTMIAKGFTGRKGKGGFYRVQKGADGRRETLVMDLQTGEYRPQHALQPLPKEQVQNLSALIAAPKKTGAYAWTMLEAIVRYAGSLVGEIADDIVAIDDAMKLGFNWQNGPFELSDRLGPGLLATRLRSENRPVPAMLEIAGDRPFYRVEKGHRQYLTLEGEYMDIARAHDVLLLADIKLASPPILANTSAALWDIGDGIAAFEFTTKMNVLDEGSIDLLEQSIEHVTADFKALVIYNEAPNFSAGADLGQVVSQIDGQEWAEIDRRVARGQQAFKTLKQAPFPVIAAPAGLALGGGCEICLHSDAIQAHAETYFGLVEMGVGIIPGWGGCKEMLIRFGEGGVIKAFKLIAAATVSKSAADARDVGFLRASDRITMNRDHLLADAKQYALDLVSGYTPPSSEAVPIEGSRGYQDIMTLVEQMDSQGLLAEYDLVLAARLARTLTGAGASSATEDDLYDLERQALVESAKDPRTRARMEYTLKTGKPLKN